VLSPPPQVEEAGDDADALPVMALLGSAELQEDAEGEPRVQRQRGPGGDSEPDSEGSSASSVVGEEAPAGPQKPPVPPLGVVVDLSELLERHGLSEKFSKVYAGDRQIGRIQHFGRNCKALCMSHGSGSDCILFLSTGGKYLSHNRAYAVLYRWLGDGRTMTQQEHQAFAKDLKAQVGMKPQ
jgi:hypothetical protein